MRRFDLRRAGLRSAVGSFTFLALASCGGHNHLSRYAFANRAMAVVYLAPPAPELRTGIYSVRGIHTPLDAVVRAGTGVAKEVEGRKASARLDSASMRVDVAARMAHRTLERASRYLGTRAVMTEDSADYVLEVNMRDFGIDARRQSAAYLYMNAEAVLLDRHTGHEIWNMNVHGSDRLTPYVQGTRRVPTGIITAGALSTVSVEDFQVVLEQLSDFSSDLITGELRDALWDVREQQASR